MITNDIRQLAIVEQTATADNGRESVLASLLRTELCPNMNEALEARDMVGQAKYGVSLQPYNGRDALVDSFQEGCDLIMYLRQAQLEGTPRAGALLLRAIALTEAIQDELRNR